MVKYDPENELTEQELDSLAKEDFDMFLDYLDQKSEYLRRPAKGKVAEMKQKKNDILKKNGVKNEKTRRDQWFD